MARTDLPANTIIHPVTANGQSESANNVLISYTGGKDSTLVLGLLLQQLKEQQQPSINIKGLVTFSPPNKPFLAHPLHIIKKQAEALGFPHRVCIIEGTNFVDAYKEWFIKFNKEEGIDYLATGDIEDVCNGFLGRAAQGTPLQILSPLWAQPRDHLLKQVHEFNLQPLITCVSLTSVPEPLARQICGKLLTPEITKLIESYPLPETHTQKIDACGENGEFHTMCLGGDFFKRDLVLGKEFLDNLNKKLQVSENGGHLFLVVEEGDVELGPLKN
ncbi:hypothetical protein HDU76_004610 [Blyttiomyces sp. JEL0837]|nr:hypothetical protein HDU76_004610 [Blyttiomyces sp. JEL0837]